MKSRIKIFFLMPSLIGGGAEKALMNVLALLNYDDYEITVCSVLKKGVYVDQLPREVNFLYLFKNEILFKILFKIHQRFDFFLPMNFCFRRKLKGQFFDFGICFLDGITTELLHVGNYFGRKYTWVHSCYRSYSNFFKFYSSPRYVERLKVKRYSGLDCIVFVSHEAKSEFVEIFGSFPDMRVVYNPILTDRISQLSKCEKGLDIEDGENFIFISIGSLIPVKNHELLIESAKNLKGLDLKFIILILGSGYLESVLKKKIIYYNLENHVKLIGFTENPYKFIRKANVYVMTSKSEALPTAMLEAMFLGKPVITTNVSGSREIVGMGNFGLLTDENPDSFSKVMRDLMENKNLYYHFKEKAQLRATEFTDERFLISFTDLLCKYP